jgi:hypothetical protein
MPQLQAVACQQQVHLQTMFSAAAAHLQPGQLQQQQVQLVPVLVPAALAQAAVNAGNSVTRAEPIESQTLWTATKKTVNSLVQHAVAKQQEQHQQKQQSLHAKFRTAASARWLQAILQPAGFAVTAAAAILLYMLIVLIAAVLGIKLRMQMMRLMVASALAAAATFCCCSATAFKQGMWSAATAANVEELQALVQQQQQHSAAIPCRSKDLNGGTDVPFCDIPPATVPAATSNSTRNVRRLLPLGTVEAICGKSGSDVAMAGTSGCITTTSSSSSSSVPALSVYETAAAGFGRLLTVLGLWCGVWLWTGRWLILQAPAASRQAVLDSCKSSTSAAESATLAVLGYVFGVVYGLLWMMTRYAQALGTRLAQQAYQYGTAAAQHVIYAVLFAVDLLFGEHAKQRTAWALLVVHTMQAAVAAAGKVFQLCFGAVEAVTAAVAAKLLKEASPVTQTAVWGLAGMIKRNLTESCELGWQLLLQLSQVYVSTQKQAASATRSTG